MAKDKNHVYSIDLDVKATEASKQAFKELQTAFESSNKNMDALNNSYMWLERHTKDTVELEKQYNKIVKAQLDARDEEIEQLKAKKVSITANTKLTQKERLEALKALDESIKSLETEKQQIKAKKEELKLRIKESRLLEKTEKIFKRQFNEESKKYKLAKNVVKLQEKLVGLLAKESKLRKAIGAVGRTGFKAAKFGAKAGLKAGAGAAAGALAIGGALAGAAAGAANDMAEKEHALGSLKSGIDRSVVDEVYVKTGADYGSIVAAINNLSDVTKDSAALVQGAVLEIRNPGAGKLLLSTTNMGKDNIGKLDNAIAQIKKQTGVQDMSAALEAATKSALVTGKKVSQTEYIQAFAALQQRGFDEEQIEKIIRDTASKKGDFIDNLNKADLGKYTRDKQMKNRLANTQLGLNKLDLNKEGESTNTAESTAEKLRRFELKKNELLVKFLPVVESMINALDSALKNGVIDKIATGLVSFLTTVIPVMAKIFEKIAPYVNKIVDLITDFGGYIVRAIKAWWDGEEVSDEDKQEIREKKPSGGSRAQGGVITAPSLVGEAGPELVLPLDYSRAGRTSQIIQNFNTNQSFNMASNQQTPLAFSQAVGNNRFVKRVNGL